MTDRVELRTVHSVATPSFAAFRAVAPLVYHDDPSWAPASEAAVRERFADAVARRIRLHAVVAVQGGQPLARAAGILEPAARDGAGRPEGWVGLFECVSGAQGEEAGLAVLADARRWLRGRGAGRVVGPRTDALMAGLLVEGFDQPQAVFTAHNPARYRDLFLRSGATPETELLSYRFTREHVPAFPPDAAPGVTVRSADPETLADDVVRLHAFQGEVFADGAGHLRRDVLDTERLVQRLLPLVDPQLVLFAEDPDAELIGVLICLPDAWQQRAFGTAPDRARLLSIGVRDGSRRQGVALAMGAALAERLLAGGYRSLEGSWVLGNNRPPQQLAGALEATAARRFELFTW